MKKWVSPQIFNEILPSQMSFTFLKIFWKNNTFPCKAKDTVTYQQDLAVFCMLFVVMAGNVVRVTRKENMGTWIKKEPVVMETDLPE